LCPSTPRRSGSSKNTWLWPDTPRTSAGLDRALDPASVYRNIVRHYGLDTGINAEVNGLCVHSLRATAATNALSHQADIAKVQEWLGHANVSTTRLYDSAQDPARR
jgi:integrase/recombinase XerD